ncbi:MAG: acyl-CoA dehydrogenase family protein [Deltaproteobacteria bacterium]|nr:acyl-CoA dehydrogenase family protein [Deltaproteobacteria bacterium]
MTMAFPDQLLRVQEVTCSDSTTWWAGHRALVSAGHRPIDVALLGGAAADRVAWAFASGYQAALRALVVELPDVVVSLCATEAAGAHPSAIATRLESTGAEGGLRVTGEKRWATAAPEAGLLLVVASIGVDDQGRNRLRVVRVPTTRAGVSLSAGTATAFAPELGHASVSLADVEVSSAEVLPGDGYTRYLKPFRTIEDIHVHAALLGLMLGSGRRAGLSPALLERLLAAAVTTRALAAANPTAATTHLALAGALALTRALVADFTAAFAEVAAPEVLARWQRDLPLLDIAARARVARTETAWKHVAEAAAAAAAQEPRKRVQDDDPQR